MKRPAQILLIYFFLIVSGMSLAQKTIVTGTVIDGETKELMPFVNLHFKDSKIGTATNIDGEFSVETYYATDSLVAQFVGYAPTTIYIELDKKQEVQIELFPASEVLGVVNVKPPDENPAFKILRRVKRNKPVNDKKKLESYQYETYNKMQFDLSNLTEKFEKRKLVRRLRHLTKYIDSLNGKKILPILLSESVSDIYYSKKLNQKKEVVLGSRLTGIKNFNLEDFAGEMYQDVNIYENQLLLFNKPFISPISDFGKQHYKYYLEDSLTVNGNWCYHIRFKPKRKGQPCFQGDMWIADTSYAVKRIQVTIPSTVNLNFISDVKIEQDYAEVEPEVWMLTKEKLIADMEIYENTDLPGVFIHKTTTRQNFKINKPIPKNTFGQGNSVELLDSAKTRSEKFWELNRHDSLNKTEKGIIAMQDSLENNKFYKFIKNFGTMMYSGFYPTKYIEIGDLHRMISFNQIEGLRTEFSLQTSNDFSKRWELKGKIAYGFQDKKVKYGFQVRFNTTPKMRGMLRAYINSDLEQLGASFDITQIGSTFGSLIQRGPVERLTLVNKIGLDYEKDWVSGFTTYTQLEWRQFLPVGKLNYQKEGPNGSIENINKIETAEIVMQFRYGKGEKYLSGVFNRRSLGAPKYPILNFRYTLGIKNIFKSDYNYHKLELSMEHRPKIGILGRLRYNIYGGKIFGTLPYPFLKVHTGNQSYYLQTEAFNNMKFFEFVSDQYVGFNFEHHLLGLIFDRIPGIRTMKWRFVTSAKLVWGTLDDKHRKEMIIPETTHSFGKIPYVEVGLGIENIFKVLRIDCVWRVTHLDKPGALPFGVRAKFQFDF